LYIEERKKECRIIGAKAEDGSANPTAIEENDEDGRIEELRLRRRSDPNCRSEIYSGRDVHVPGVKGRLSVARTLKRW
jgi:hypothetical protein